VSWQSPKKRNGDIVGYIVTYETMGRNEQFSKQVKQVSEATLLVSGLEEEVCFFPVFWLTLHSTVGKDFAYDAYGYEFESRLR